MLKNDLIASIHRILESLGYKIDGDKIILDHPSDPKHGDYCSNIAMLVHKKFGIKEKTPFDFACELASVFFDDPMIKQHCSKAKAVAPGFINFYLSEPFLINSLKALLDSPPDNHKEKGDLEMYENTQPNTNKPLHIGHLRNIAIGEAIVALRKATKHKVWSVNINNDRGINICKAMMGYLYEGKKHKDKDYLKASWQDLLFSFVKDPEGWETPSDQKRELLAKPDHFIGFYYVKGSELEEKEPRFKEYLSEMLISWEKGDKDNRFLWKRLNDWFYEGFMTTHARFTQRNGKQFDKQWYESEIYEASRQIVLENLKTGIFYKRADGVILANLKKYNLPDKVFIRSDGTTVYITQDLELARLRIKDDKAGFIAFVVGNEQDLHFRQLFAVCQELGFGTQDKFRHISYGMVTLKGGLKMSSREGNVITADYLMDYIKTVLKDKFSSLSDQSAEDIMLGVIKYWMLKHSSKQNIDFDIEKSISLQGDSGPYLQYACVRAKSVLSYVKNIKLDGFNVDYLPEETERLLLRQLFYFPEIIAEASDKFSTNLFCSYLFSLGQIFNLFYQKYSILPKDKQSLSFTAKNSFRLALTKGFLEVMTQGLRILGIATVDKM